MADTYALLAGQIGLETAEQLVGLLQNSVNTDCKCIHLAIHSSGGSVPIALALANILQSLPCEIVTYNMGNVDSAAVIVFAAGTTRICARDAVFHTHPISKELTGPQTADMLLSAAREIHADTERVANYLSRQTTKTSPAEWKSLMSGANTISACLAVKMGLADRIGEHRRSNTSELALESVPKIITSNMNRSVEPPVFKE